MSFVLATFIYSLQNRIVVAVVTETFTVGFETFAAVAPEPWCREP
jgi:hypothetical protein